MLGDKLTLTIECESSTVNLYFALKQSGSYANDDAFLLELLNAEKSKQGLGDVPVSDSFDASVPSTSKRIRGSSAEPHAREPRFSDHDYFDEASGNKTDDRGHAGNNEKVVRRRAISPAMDDIVATNTVLNEASDSDRDEEDHVQDPSDSNVPPSQVIMAAKNSVQCAKCLKCFSSVARLEVHMKLHSKSNPFKCGKCNLVYAASHGLTYHLEKNRCNYRKIDARRLKSCQVCNMQFSSSAQLQHHKKTAKVSCSRSNRHLNKKFEKFKMAAARPTVNRGRELRSVTMIKMSASSKDSDAIYRCSVCKVISIGFYPASQHSYTHGTRVFFRCLVCKKCFSRKDDCEKHCGKGKCGRLSGHLKDKWERVIPKENQNGGGGPPLSSNRLKQPSKPESPGPKLPSQLQSPSLLVETPNAKSKGRCRHRFPCPVCGLVYKDKCQIRDHLKLHFANHPYACEYCSVTYEKSTSLTHHIVYKHPDGKKFEIKSGLSYEQAVEMIRGIPRPTNQATESPGAGRPNSGDQNADLSTSQIQKVVVTARHSPRNSQQGMPNRDCVATPKFANHSTERERPKPLSKKKGFHSPSSTNTAVPPAHISVDQPIQVISDDSASSVQVSSHLMAASTSHARAQSQLVPSPVTSLRGLQKTNWVRCDVCNTFCIRDSLQSHVASHGFFPYRCQFCPAMFSMRDRMIEHQGDRHAGENLIDSRLAVQGQLPETDRYQCDDCSGIFDGLDQLGRHQADTH